MNRALKQRLLGAVVLVALLSIFIPPLLDGSGHYARFTKELEIPPEPEFEPIEESFAKIKAAEPPTSVPQPVAPSEPESAQAILKPKPAAPPPEPVPAENKKADQAQPVPTPPATVEKKSPIDTWALQVGSFSSEGNALAFRDQLREEGYAAYIVTQRRGEESVYRVRIGPELDRDRIGKLKETFLKQRKIDGVIVQHP